MFNRLRKSGVRSGGMSFLYDEVLTSSVVIFDELVKAAEQMRVLCVNPSPPIARGSPAYGGYRDSSLCGARQAGPR
jgi:hypothetical protein